MQAATQSNNRSTLVVALLLFAVWVETAQAKGCCSNNYKDCDAAYLSNKNQCNRGTNNEIWLTQGALSGCLARWSACTNDENGCCPGLSCVGTQYYKQCLVSVDVAPATAAPVTADPPGTCTYCGTGTIGMGVCEDSSLCCSVHGWCDLTSAHCANEEPCGGGVLGSGVCADKSLCCSAQGFCVSTSECCEGTTPSPIVSPVTTASPTSSPIASTNKPTDTPTDSPVKATANPTTSPTNSPVASTEAPTTSPTTSPVGSTIIPTSSPSSSPVVSTDQPTRSPTWSPVESTDKPTGSPTASPVESTDSPTKEPSPAPTTSPITEDPTPSPVPPSNTCSSTRCGTSWSDANSKCGAPCTNSCTDPQESCYADLDTSLSCCTSDGPPPSTCSYCGSGVVGNGLCLDGNCCSKWGYCGTSSAHCIDSGTCGNGQIGDGVCSDRSLCCSASGYCGSGEEYCGCADATGRPTPSPVVPTSLAPVAPTVPGPMEDSRLVAFLGNWQPCPSEAQVAKYSHILISFAVSYSWSPAKNNCSPTCQINTPPVCNNQPNQQLIQDWQAAGKKVLLSFGGAGMGGSWAGDVNDCWEDCFGREVQVVNSLSTIINDMGLDGIDIDYEYFYEDSDPFRKGGTGAAARNFLTEVTTGLRNSLPAGSIVTHAPMDSDVGTVVDSGYYNLLKSLALTGSIDFLMPQYYNGPSRPKTDFAGTLAHYNKIADEMFGGDATKVVFGFCIGECGNYNVNSADASSIMVQLHDEHSCNGGAFFWVVNDDTDGAWSTDVSNTIASSRICA